MSPLLQHIAQFVSLTPAEQQEFLGFVSQLKLKKKTFLYKEGDSGDKSAFVISGCLRAYSIDKNGVEHILQFAPANWWITDMHSLLSGRPAKLNIDALEDSEVFVMTRQQQEAMFDAIPKMERYFRVLLEKSLVANRQRVLDNMELSARERYLNFCKTYPGLIHSVPQKQIASYLGITPEFLSKLRAEVK
jgi:CRP-like cAMP-binding protein